MEQGAMKRFFRPTRFKIVFTVCVFLLALFSMCTTVYCFSTHSNIGHEVCNSVGVMFGVLYIYLFTFPTFIFEAYSWKLAHSIPFFIRVFLNIAFTLSLSYLLGCVLSSVIGRKKN